MSVAMRAIDAAPWCAQARRLLLRLRAKTKGPSLWLLLADEAYDGTQARLLRQIGVQRQVATHVDRCAVSIGQVVVDALGRLEHLPTR
jgi:hypothetical protein